MKRPYCTGYIEMDYHPHVFSFQEEKSCNTVYIWIIFPSVSYYMIHKYTLLWEILVTLITFYDFSPACVLLWKVSDPRFFRSSIKSQTVEKPFICIYCVKKFSLICIFNIPTRKLLEKDFLCIIQIKFTCQMENIVYWLLICLYYIALT